MNQNNLNQVNEYRKFGIKGYLSYGCGDLSNNVAFGVLTGMITFFCTDYAGISAGVVAMILAISRIPDAVSDFIMGLIVENTHSKLGKARPWIARMGIPLAICMVLLFCVPSGAGQFAKAVYIFIVYNLFSTVCYTAVNLPYSALSSLMTRDQQERTKLCSWRMGMAPWGRVAAVAVATPMIKFFGDDQKAWIIVMAIWAAISLIPLFICYRNCEEIVVATPEDDMDTKIAPLKSIAICLKNPYWWAVGIMWGVTAASTSLIGSILPYYCKYNLGNSVYYSPVSTSELVVMCVMAFATPMFTKYIRAKRTIVVWGAIIGVAVQVVFWVAAPESVTGLVIVTIARSIAVGPISVLVFSMMSDVVEYTHWKYHVRQEGMIFSATGMFYKAFAAFTTLIVGFILDNAGYIASTGGDVQQSQAVIDLIPNIYNIGMIGIWLMAAVVGVFWKIDKQYDQIIADLTERRERGEM